MLRRNLRKNRFLPYIIVFLVAFLLGVNVRNIVPAATVNGEAIDRKTFYDKVLRLSGEGVMNELITQKIIFQEARKRKILIDKKEIKERVAQLEKNLSKQGVNLKAYLLRQRQTVADLEREVETQLLVEKMFKPQVRVTDADIDNYFKQNRIVRGNGAVLESQLIAIRQQVYQEKLRLAFLTWLTAQSKTAKVLILIRG